MSLAWWNGRLLPLEEVRIDPGEMLGDGLFETLRVDDGQAGDVEAHLERLSAGLPRVGIDPPDLSDAVTAVAEASPWPIARMRIAVTPSTRLVSLEPYTPPTGPVTAVLLPEPWIWSRSPLAGLKSLSYQTNRMALRKAGGAFEALLLNEHGRLVEGSRSNVILALPDGLFTPPVADGCLPGTVRRRLLERGEIAERPLTPEDLERASRILLTNSLIGVLEVDQVGRPS